MSTFFETRYACNPAEVKQMNTEQLRRAFLIEQIFKRDTIQWIYTHYDRYMAGGIMPIQTVLLLETMDVLKSDYFLERREIGIINIGGVGVVNVDDESFELNNKEALYIGRGRKVISFASKDASVPAKFYVNSALAHFSYPARKIKKSDVEMVTLGSTDTANHRSIYKLLVAPVIQTCQLQMGITELKPGSIWNTMPPHTHDRRMEVYFYFDFSNDQAVCHFMGQPQETRHIWIQQEQAVISPPWSIHAGAGTSHYSFIWGMAGENLDYSDMDHCAVTSLK
ncbi:MAG: 5-dehydro-4-deoxy-D-glucuronate isomerase [Chitinophagaceae bacterium]|nr:5-dehydro-4-deoxy-D-glucuronate isomerase [Chitinophagaceae bacterium]